MRFAYARRGGPMLEWDGRSPPSAARAGETRSLGSLDVPRAGAPEIVSGYESPEPGAATIHLGADPAPAPAPAKFDLGLIRKASALAAGYHGVRRNNGSIFWGLIWAAAAFISPLYGTLVPAFAMAQGFGEARPKSNPAGKRRRGSGPSRRTKSATALRPRTEAEHQRELAKLYRESRPKWIVRRGKKYVVLNPGRRRK